MAPGIKSHLLVDRILGGTLREFLVQRREVGVSCESIAREIERDHGLSFTGETIRRWCRELEVVKPERASA